MTLSGNGGRRGLQQNDAAGNDCLKPCAGNLKTPPEFETGIVTDQSFRQVGSDVAEKYYRSFLARKLPARSGTDTGYSGIRERTDVVLSPRL